MERYKLDFEPNGVLRDIYVQEVNIDDWKKLIDFLNSNYKLKILRTNENRIDEK